jgi:hypothetical protein
MQSRKQKYFRSKSGSYSMRMSRSGFLAMSESMAWYRSWAMSKSGSWSRSRSIE